MSYSRDRYYYVPYYADESASNYYPEVPRVTGRVGNSEKMFVVNISDKKLWPKLEISF